MVQEQDQTQLARGIDALNQKKSVNAKNHAEQALANQQGQPPQTFDQAIERQPHLNDRLEALLESNESIRSIAKPLQTLIDKLNQGGQVTQEDLDELHDWQVELGGLVSQCLLFKTYLLSYQTSFSWKLEQVKSLQTFAISTIQTIMGLLAHFIPEMAMLNPELDAYIKSIHQYDQADPTVQQFQHEFQQASSTQEYQIKAAQLLLEPRGARILEVVRVLSDYDGAGKQIVEQQRGYSSELIRGLRITAGKIIKDNLPAYLAHIGKNGNELSTLDFFAPEREGDSQLAFQNTAAALDYIENTLGISLEGIAFVFGNQTVTIQKYVKGSPQGREVVAEPTIVLQGNPDMQIDDRTLRVGILHELGHAIHNRGMLSNPDLALRDMDLGDVETEVVAMLFEGLLPINDMEGADISAYHFERLLTAVLYADFEETLYETKASTPDDAKQVWKSVVEKYGLKDSDEIQPWLLKPHFLGSFPLFFWQYVQANIVQLGLRVVLEPISNTFGAQGVVAVMEKYYASKGRIKDLDAAVYEIEEVVAAIMAKHNTGEDIRSILAELD